MGPTNTGKRNSTSTIRKKSVRFSSKVSSENKVLDADELDILHQLKRIKPHLRCTAFGLSTTAYGYDTNPEEVYNQELKARKEVKAEREALMKEVNEKLLRVESTWEMSKIDSIGAWFEKDSTRKFLSFVAIAAAIGILCTRGGTKKDRTKKDRMKKHR